MIKIAICDKIGLCYDGDTLKNHGLGGSESAVILMSKELQKLGFSVTVFNNCIDSSYSKEGIFDGVRYIDNSNAASHNETYDITIVSRTIEPFVNTTRYPFLQKSKLKVLWLHDTFCEGDEHVEPLLVNGVIDHVFTLSDFHTSYVLTCNHGKKRMYEVLKDKVFQTRNGAVKYIDDVDLSKKDKNHFVYNASLTKGLIPLIEDIWPEIKKRIPTARLTVIGGYYRFREDSELDDQGKKLKQLIKDPKFSDLGITFTDIIPQPKIAEILSTAGFMIYPNIFPETFGISTLESLLYKTPLITTNFGALEETAVDNACYKIDYPVEPNVVFPHINKEIQIKKFIELVVYAYNNDYLTQQKQNYCSVVDDIAGWDTVAIEWKRFFYNKLGKFLPVDEYRKAKIITDKVNRIFGRVNNMPNYKEYNSFGGQNRIIIVSPFYNSEKYIENCILSVAQQDYQNYVHILINDKSTDNSFEVAKATIEQLPTDIRNKFLLVNNNKNKGAIYNQITAITSKNTKPDDIIMLLDGDDWLVNNNTLFHLYNDYYQLGAEFTYGSCWSLVDNIPLVAQDYPNNVKQDRSYRNHKFNWGIPYTHLRTFKKSLFDKLENLDGFKDINGEFYRAGGDNAMFYEIIEQANPENVIAVKEIVYNYNDINPLNDYKVNGIEQNKNASLISNKNNIEKFSVVVPTMWRCNDVFEKILTELSNHTLVDEIIIINNEVNNTPDLDILNHYKIKMLNQKENIYVNPAWNLGVHESKNDKICLLNDDLWFDIKLLNKIHSMVTPENGAFGLCPGIEEFNQPPYIDGNIDIIEWNAHHTYGFGCLMFINKESWEDIPDELKIYYGDNFIFDNCTKNGKPIYIITNIKHSEKFANTTSDKNITDGFLEKEQVIYDKIMNNRSDNKKRLLIGIPSKKYIENETYKSIYDLNIPENYEVEFQYFYGYSREQIMNLMAEWAKNYDYTLFIKANSILDENLLIDIDNLNSDIVSIDNNSAFCVSKKVFNEYLSYPHFWKRETDKLEIESFISRATKAGASVSYLENKIKFIETFIM